MVIILLTHPEAVEDLESKGNYFERDSFHYAKTVISINIFSSFFSYKYNFCDFFSFQEIFTSKTLDADYNYSYHTKWLLSNER